MSKKVDEAYERGYEDGRCEASRDVRRLWDDATTWLRTSTIAGIETPAAAATLMAFLEDAQNAAADNLDWSSAVSDD